ncbi:cation:proton antiporter [Suttonella ornithocola]|uniref:Potassium/proton antiporter n=1 Tax=Suttonella ornithocola TaxID=279832 RepID=A0A380MM44_9GAMM|nr:sodium:proton antiporter [Suttonella ornithocola]SUO93695.1 potassium/proton antiporter [Suttonella ornithocola]
MKDLSLAISSLLALGIAAQWLGWFFKKPAIIFLLAAGILLGPTFHLFNPDEMLGELLFPLISLGVAIILFEGALTLNLQEIKNHGRVVTNLVSIGVIITIAITTLAARWIMDLSWQVSMLFGALVCVTGPTVIVPLLRSVRPNRTISNILRWEGIIIDPIGALLVVLIYEWIIAGHSPIIFATIILLGLTLGIASAFFTALLLKRQWVPEYLHNVFTLAVVLFVFSVSNAIEEESGLLTVTVMGMVMANVKRLHTEDILDFKESLSILIISMLFIILSARIQFSGFIEMGIGGLGVLIVVMFIARPLSVWISSIGSPLSTNEKLLISWIAPRGIVAAAVSSLFVLKLQESQTSGADILVPMVFTIIIGTVMLQSLTAKSLANFLGVADPNPNGVLISSGGDFAILLGNALKDNGFDVIVSNTSYSQTRKARMTGLSAYYGNIVSEHADRHLNLVGLGHLLALHSREEENLLAVLRYRTEFGSDKVYQLKITENSDQNERGRATKGWLSDWLFGKDITYQQLMQMTAEGASTKTTTLSDAYPWAQYREENPDAIPLFAVTPQQKLHLFTAESRVEPGKGWKVIALIPYSREKVEKAAKKAQEQKANEEGNA